MSEVDPEVRELLDRWAATPATPLSELTARAVREDDRAVLDLQRVPGELYSVEDVEAPGPAGTLIVRVYRPHPGRLHPVLFLHGGGFVIGRDGYDAPLRELALASGCMIVTPSCRLAPEHPFPAAADDALATARWLHAEASALGARETTPGVAGDSSGGNLAATVTHALTREGAPPSFQVLIYPMLDATASSASYEEFVEGYGFSSKKSRWYFDQYLPAGIDRRAPRVSPLFDRGLSNLPATLIVTAAFDPLRDDGERHAKRLRDAGVTVELRRYGGMIHGFFQMTRHLKAHGGCIASSANGCVRPRVTDLHDRRGTDERKHRGMRRGRRVSPLIFSSCDALCVRGRVIVFRVASLPRFVIDRGRCRDGTAWASSEAEGASP